MSFLKLPFSDGCWTQKEKNNSDEASPRGREREKWKGRGANFKYRCGLGGGGAQLWQRRRRQTACSGFLKTVSGASASEGWSQREPVKTAKVRRASVRRTTPYLSKTESDALSSWRCGTGNT